MPIFHYHSSLFVDINAIAVHLSAKLKNYFCVYLFNWSNKMNIYVSSYPSTAEEK
jgi:hypothetical protein